LPREAADKNLLLNSIRRQWRDGLPLEFDRTGTACGRRAPWREDAGRPAPEQGGASRALGM